MEASKSAVSVPGRPGSVALDFLMLAGASVIAGLVTAAIVAAFVILLSSSPESAVDRPEGPAPGTAAAAAVG